MNIVSRIAQVAVLGAIAFVPSSMALATTVILDTGHTPRQPGSTSPSGNAEYYYNLTMTDVIARNLQGRGIKVIRVAADGRDIALTDRTAGTDQADLLLSIHHDSIQQAWIDAGWRRKFSGYAVFVSQKNPAYGKSLGCGKAIGLAMQKTGEHPSLYHATPIKGENRPQVDQAAGVHRFDDLVVLKSAKSPAVLVEVGVIANPEEEGRLREGGTVQKLGAAIADAAVACLQ
jgi:N-acetylmuramoyl-L-alanine amidase